MKSFAFAALFFLCLSPAFGAYSITYSSRKLLTVLSKNEIENGDLTEWSSDKSELVGWEMSKSSTGPGSNYNRKWGNTTVTVLDGSEGNGAATYPIQLDAGNYYGAFDWAPQENVALESSQIRVKWNGILFLHARASNREQFFTQEMIFKTRNAGTRNDLTIAGAGTSDGRGATFSNFRVHKVSQSFFSFRQFETLHFDIYGFRAFESYQQPNLIRNGGFDEKIEGYPSLILSLSNSSIIPGWEVKGKGQTLPRSVVNLNWDDPSSITAVLGLQSDSQFITKFQGVQDYYYISFNFLTIFFDRNKVNSEFIVRFNGRKIFKYFGVPPTVKRQFLQVRGREGTNTLTFQVIFSGDQARRVSIDDVEVHAIQ